MVDFLDVAPACMFAEVLTITDVNGKPPINPETIFPMPWALSSLFVGVTRLYGSISSDASMFNNVSRLAIKAMVSAVVHTADNEIALKSGDLKKEKKPLNVSAMGMVTR